MNFSEGEIAQLTIFAGWLLNTKGANYFKTLRLSANLTIDGAVKLSGIPKSYIAALEMDSIKKPDPNKTDKLEEVYNALSVR